MGSACVTRVCARAHDRNRRRSRAILSRGHEKGKEEGRREKGDSCANGVLRAASGPLSSSGRAREKEKGRERERERERASERAREKRVRKKMIGQDLRYKKRFVPLAHVLARPYGIPFPGAKNARRSRSRGRAGGFCSWPRPELRTKRIRAPFFFPGRISPKGPASMRDASDLRLILYRCPRFTSGPGTLHLSLLLLLCPLDSETSIGIYVSPFLLPFFFSSFSSFPFGPFSSTSAV